MNDAQPASRSALREVRESLRGKRGVLVLLGLWSLVEALPAFLGGLLVTHAVDAGFAVDRPLAGLAWLLLLGITVFVGAWGTREVYPRLAAIVEPFRDDLLRRVVRGALARSASGEHLGDDASGVARLTQQVEIAREAYAGLLMVVRGFVFTVGGALLGMLWLDSLLLVLVLPPLAVGLVFFFLFVGRMKDRQRELIMADERLAEGASTAAGGLRDIVAFGAEGRAADALGRRVDEQALAGARLASIGTARFCAVAIGGWTPLLMVIAAAPWLLRNGATPGTVMGALVYITQALLPALQTLIQGLGGSGIRLSVALQRINETSGSHTSCPALLSGPKSARLPDGYGVVLRNITFGYGEHAVPVIRGLDLEIPQDDHLAIVGPSGIGKSTLAGLVSGLIEPMRGDIWLGGVLLKRLDPHLVAQRRVLIPQEAYIFSGTVEENLGYLRPEASRAEMEATVEALGLHPLMERLGGYRALVRPSELSAGERQQIALARAHLSAARLVILDEATCHMDPVAEALAEEAFAHRPGSLVVIAHRVSSALRARRILVLDGTRAELGGHEELLVSSPLYRDLVGHWRVGNTAEPG
ncbi:ABC transporter ATP-binding protein [Streptomyces inusitatus]|uniref:ABC transporter ATP-binding protein n=1 Tax=Streptomyces inusitatus TaxID=68221 RepID=A0A918Q618_9ACTN|nr:ABC transporter ATP-binding protein [Streptomyces inusitatus]GGZ32182.1 ABC transporter ATP-binding protein [Streptomyces inusitatus]